jgi:hypothetical protein
VLHVGPVVDASADVPTRSKPRLASSRHTDTATIAVSGASTMNTWNCDTIIGVPSANATASRPARSLR